MSDALYKVGLASEAMAECALAMKVDGEKATMAAKAWEAAAEANEKLGVNSEQYREIAKLFRSIEAQNTSLGFDEMIRELMYFSEACK